MRESSTEKDRRIFCSRLDDMAERVRVSGKPEFLGFLDDGERRYAEEFLKYSGLRLQFWGGFPDAERVCLGLSVCEETASEAFPFRCFRLSWRKEDTLGHRDILGALMGLQITRESIGDILTGEGTGAVFVMDTVAPVVSREFRQAGRCGIRCEESSFAAIGLEKRFEPVEGTVSSLRLDCTVAFLARCSRGEAEEKISSGLVSVDGIPAVQSAKTIPDGCKISIRGVGKFAFDGQDGLSRKGRIRVHFRKYQ